MHTFLDDLVASVAANASSRMAHRMRDEQEAEIARLEAEAARLEAVGEIQVKENEEEQAG